MERKEIDPSKPQLLSPEEIADLAGVTPTQVHFWMGQNRLPFHPAPEKKEVFDIQLQDFLDRFHELLGLDADPAVMAELETMRMKRDRREEGWLETQGIDPSSL